MTSKQNYDVIIIGAGLMGCFAARNLRRYDLSVLVLEQADDVCKGISKANTGIVYAGYDNKKGSEKSKLCIQSCKDFDRLCAELEVPFNRCGSLMVSYGPVGDAHIRKKYESGKAGGIHGLQLLNGIEAEEMEPELRKGVSLALYSEDTGTVNPWELCIAAYENARANGAEFRFNSKVTGIERKGHAFELSYEELDASCEGEPEVRKCKVFAADNVINAAGLNSDRIREMLEKPGLRICPSAADYIVLDFSEAGFVKHIIFHESEDGKGATIVPTVDGNLLLGPTDRRLSDAELINAGFGMNVARQDDEPDRMQMAGQVSDKGLEQLKEMCEAITPNIRLDKQLRCFGSMRPKVNLFVETDEGYVADRSARFDDITIQEDDGLISLIGIKTPGMTFANSLGEVIAERVVARRREFCEETEPNLSFNPHRKQIGRVRDMDLEARAKAIADDSDYGEIICSCMDVSRAEVIEAIERGANSYEAVKRRTGVGMGNCQGSRCRTEVMKLIELNKK